MGRVPFPERRSHVPQTATNLVGSQAESLSTRGSVLHGVARRRICPSYKVTNGWPDNGPDLQFRRERATGIEPAFSAWEAHRGVLRDLRISGKV